VLEPRRRIPGWAVGSALATFVATILLSLLSDDLHDFLVAEFGTGYTMQFFILGLSWRYLPHMLFLVAVFGLWRWSQGAPAERVVERIEYREREVPPSTIALGEVTWDHYSMPHADHDEFHHLQLHASIVASAHMNVLSIRLDLAGHDPLYAADPRVDDRGQSYLFSAIGSSSSIARQNATWLWTPRTVEPGKPASGWLGFIIPHGYAMTYGELRGNHPVLVAALDDGSELRVTIPPPTAPAS